VPSTLSDLKDDLVSILKEQATELLQGAAEDLHGYVHAISTDLTRALMLPPERRQDLLVELVAQLAAVGEINRIRAEAAAWKTFERIVMTAGQVLISAALAAVPVPTPPGPGA
jgi:hypothetical protein